MIHYRFSPIKDEKAYREALVYIAAELDKLSVELLGVSLSVNTLKVFPHYPAEYTYLRNLISAMGPAASFSSDTSMYVQVDEKIGNSDIKYLGVRIVDPYRLHVGCGDFEVEDFAGFKQKYAGKSEFVRAFREDMVELWHPDYDVLGYVVPAV